MDELLKKYTDYMRLENCRAQYELVDGTNIEITYKEENFPHLLGLHKLKDIQLIQFWLDRNNRVVKLSDVIRHIKNGTFTDGMVKNSHFYGMIEERYENFSYDNLTTLNYTDAIINFDPVKINSLLKSDYILFEERPSAEYNHMGIAKDVSGSSRYIETFFHEKTDKYIAGQAVVKIKKFTLYDPDGNLIVVDMFEENSEF